LALLTFLFFVASFLLPDVFFFLISPRHNFLPPWQFLDGTWGYFFFPFCHGFFSELKCCLFTFSIVKTPFRLVPFSVETLGFPV